MGAKHSRLDERLVADGLVGSKTQAQARIRLGEVLVDDVPVEKPGTRVRTDAAIRLRGQLRRFVSRGGDKLAGALDDLGLDPSGRFCLDIGASTGGFTDCLLQRGAVGVVAVDVGYGQMEGALRNDPRVRVLDRTNARNLEADQVPEEIGLVSLDVSFISSTLILPRLPEVAPGADLLVMVKPQFEVGREKIGKGGVVRSDEDRAAAVERVRESAAALGYAERGRADSQLPGPKGNREIFLWLSPSGSE